MIILADSYNSVNKEKNDVLRLMKDLRNNSWFVCELAYSKTHRNGISKRLYGFTESNDLSTAVCNKSMGCRSFEAVKSRTTSRRCPIYFFGSKNEELEKMGLIYSVVGKGSFVSEQNKEMILERKQKVIEEQLSQAVMNGKEIGLSLHDMQALVALLYEEAD